MLKGNFGPWDKGNGPSDKRFRKDVALRINKSGLSADGRQRYVLAVRFTDESYKKASNTEYVLPYVDDEPTRMYFETSDSKKGYKLSGSNKKNTYKTITVTIHDKLDVWQRLVGDYDLLKDNEAQLYYIDFKKGGSFENNGYR